MKSRLNLRLLIFVGLLFLIPIACSLPLIAAPDQPVSTKAPVDPSVVPITKTSPGEPTIHPSVEISPAEPTDPPAEPLPSLPDFNQVLTFGGGGAGFICEDLGYPESPNTISGTVTYGQHASLCMTLWGIDFGQPFRIELIAPDGRVSQSPNLRVNQSTGSVEWDGYPGFDGYAEWTSDGKVFVSLVVWWPFTFSPGQWQISASGGGFQAYGDFWVAKEDGMPYLTAFDPRSEYEIMPAWSGPSLHPLELKDNGAVDLIGIDFPTNTPVYVLLYREVVSPDYTEFVLVLEQTVLSNPDGSLATELPGPLEPGTIYLVYGITDPNTILGDTNPDSSDFVNCYMATGLAYGAACGYFNIVTPTSVSTFSSPTWTPDSSSCPGAPPQRMVINQRGYVCTQSDSVRLRDAPARSASTIVQLPIGSQFWVVDGPECAHNWSWWLIETDDGLVGWIAEGGDETDPYFICPLE